MKVTLRLSAETGQRLKDEAARQGMTVEEFVQRLAEQSIASCPAASNLPYEEWVKQFREWAASHETGPGPVDDDRDSIYAGRGE